MYTIKDLSQMSNLQEVQEHMETVYGIYNMYLSNEETNEINQYLQLDLGEWLKITNDLLKVVLFRSGKLPIDDIKEIVNCEFEDSEDNKEQQEIVEKDIMEKMKNLAEEYESLTNHDFLGYIKSMIYRGF